MKLQAGIFIKSTNALKDTFFENTIIYITEVNEKGALGFVINKPFTRRLNELVEFQHCKSFPLYDGGPVDKDHLFFVHMRPDLIEEGKRIDKGVYYGGDFTQATDAMNSNVLIAQHLKIFIGYCGWDVGELEAEIEEGSWEILEAGTEEVFRSWE